MPNVIKIYPSFKLYILGSDQGELKNLNSLLIENNLVGHVIFEGFVENPYVYYAHCDLFILSSRREGFPNVLLENYHLNTPIVSTRCVPVVEQLIRDGKNGFTCSVNNHIELAEKILECLTIKRGDIKNPPYEGSNLEVLLK